MSAVVAAKRGAPLDAEALGITAEHVAAVARKAVDRPGQTTY